MDDTSTNKTFVRVMMSKSDESRATLATLTSLQHPPHVIDKSAYWQVEHPDEIIIDADKVGDQLGREITVDEILASFATYVGRVDVNDERIRVTQELLQVEGGA